MRGVPTERAAENKKFSWEFFFHPLYLHGGQPLSVGIFCAFCHNIKVFGVVIDGTFSAQRVVIRHTISGQKHCYRGHISGDFRCYQRHNSLLFLWGCYSAHNSPKAPMSRRVLERTAHFKNPVLWVVIGDTI